MRLPYHITRFSAINAAFKRVVMALWLLTFAAALPMTAWAENTKTSAKKAQSTSQKKTNKSSASTQKSASTKHKKTTTSSSSKNKKTARHTTGSQSELENVKQQIRSTEQRIKLTREQREKKEAELKAAEVEIGQIRGNVGELQKDMMSRSNRLQDLQQEKQAHERNRDRLLLAIRSDLRIAQRQGGQDSYKMLLNEQDPQALSRLLRYGAYIQQARADRVKSLNNTLENIDSLAKEETTAVSRLQDLRGQLEKKQQLLASAQEKRAATIKLLSAELLSQDEKLKRLKRDQQALQDVVDRLAKESAARDAEQRKRASENTDTKKQSTANNTKPLPPSSSNDFKEMPYNGRCVLPAAGGIKANFGSARDGGLRWNGVLIAASEGAAVRAIRSGRVAFADYLRGYGLLIIVDHGRGLMSLYGHNQSLNKKTGDTVAANEVIASVGDSGGNVANGLYFEIRVRGRPSNPTNWCAYQ